MLSRFSHVQLFATLWTIATRLFCPWNSPAKRSGVSGLPCPPSGDLPNPGITPTSPAAPELQAASWPLSRWGSTHRGLVFMAKLVARVLFPKSKAARITQLFKFQMAHRCPVMLRNSSHFPPGPLLSKDNGVFALLQTLFISSQAPLPSLLIKSLIFDWAVPSCKSHLKWPPPQAFHN